MSDIIATRPPDFMDRIRTYRNKGCSLHEARRIVLKEWATELIEAAEADGRIKAVLLILLEL